MATGSLFDQLTTQLDASAPIETKLQSVLDLILKNRGAVTGTIHLLDRPQTHLTLLAWHGLPESVLSLSRQIPIGKGMAGVAAQRKAPVTMCNLQNDQSGVARPGAKLSGAQGAIVVPMLLGETLVGTLGIGMAGSHDFTKEEEAELLQLGGLIAQKLVKPGVGTSA